MHTHSFQTVDNLIIDNDLKLGRHRHTHYGVGSKGTPYIILSVLHSLVALAFVDVTSSFNASDSLFLTVDGLV